MKRFLNILIDNNWLRIQYVSFGVILSYTFELDLRASQSMQNRRDDIKQVDAFKVSRKLLSGINSRFSQLKRRLNRSVRVLSRPRSVRNLAYDTISQVWVRKVTSGRPFVGVALLERAVSREEPLLTGIG